MRKQRCAEPSGDTGRPWFARALRGIRRMSVLRQSGEEGGESSCARAGSTPSHRSPHTLHPPLNMSAYGASERQELLQHRITLGARPFSERIGAWLAYPRHYAKVQIGLALCALPLACFWLAFLLASIGLHLWFHQQRQGLPMRMPHDLGGIDPSLDVVKRTPNGRGERVEQHAAEGIFYLVYLKYKETTEQMKELWVTNSDARTHMLLMGATGSGKTVTL